MERTTRRQFIGTLTARGAGALLAGQVQAAQAQPVLTSYGSAWLGDPQFAPAPQVQGLLGSGFTPDELRAIVRDNTLQLIPRLRT